MTYVQLVSFVCSMLIRSVNSNCKGFLALIVYGAPFLQSYASCHFDVDRLAFSIFSTLSSVPSGFAPLDCIFVTCRVSTCSLVQGKIDGRRCVI
jgi:hypothetical protein